MREHPGGSAPETSDELLNFVVGDGSVFRESIDGWIDFYVLDDYIHVTYESSDNKIVEGEWRLVKEE